MVEEMETIEHEWVPIGTLLLRRGLIDVEQLELALVEREQSGSRLGELLVSFGWVSSRDVAVALAEQFQLPFRDLDAEPAPPIQQQHSAVSAQPGAVVLEVCEDRVVIGVDDPTDIGAIEQLRDGLDQPLELVVVDSAHVRPSARPGAAVAG
jgi:MSHA biogenesis protein MshE